MGCGVDWIQGRIFYCNFLLLVLGSAIDLVLVDRVIGVFVTV